MSDLGRAATARRLYLHVLSGGSLTSNDVSRTVQAIEELEAEVARLKDSEWQAKHTDTMNEIVSMGLARDEALARAEAAEAKLAAARDDALEEAANLVLRTAYTTSGDTRSLEPVPPAAIGADQHHATIAAAIRALKSTNQT